MSLAIDRNTPPVGERLNDHFERAISPYEHSRVDKIPFQEVLEIPESYAAALKLLSQAEPSLDVPIMENLFKVINQINVDLACYLGDIWSDRQGQETIDEQGKLELAQRESKALKLFEKLFHHWQDAKKLPPESINQYWKKLNAHFLEIAGRLCKILDDGKSPYESIKAHEGRDPLVIREDAQKRFSIPKLAASAI